MALMKWKTLRLIHELKNPWWSYRHDEVELPSGKKGEYHYVHVNGSSMIVPVDAGGKLILVNQYRHLGSRESLEFPCGSVKEGSTYDETARLELAEEAGFAAAEWKIAGEFNPYNGVTDEMCRVYMASGLTPVESQKDETEEFEIQHLARREFEDRIRSGEIWDGMTLAAWMLVKDNAPDT